jgi:hypothetical protein
MKQPVFSKRNDLTGNSILRVCRQQLLSRFIPTGNYRGGAGGRCMVVFLVLHYLGRPLFRVLVRFERELSFLYTVKERITSRDRQDVKQQSAERGT